MTAPQTAGGTGRWHAVLGSADQLPAPEQSCVFEADGRTIAIFNVDGRFYVAAKGVAVYSADGKLQRTLLEGENASNCAFGEADFESLFIAARGSIYRVKLGVKGALQY